LDLRGPTSKGGEERGRGWNMAGGRGEGSLGKGKGGRKGGEGVGGEGGEEMAFTASVN